MTHRRYATSYCPRCEQMRRFTKRAMESRPHLLATVLTLGLWGLPWMVLARRNAARLWHCCVCGKHRKTLAPYAEGYLAASMAGSAASSCTSLP